HYPSFPHALKVPDAAPEEIRICEDELLSAERTDTSGLYPDPLDCSELFSHNNKIPNLKRPIEEYRERGKEIAENILHGESDGNTADSKPGDKCRDVHADVVEHQENDNYPYERTRREGKEPKGGQARRVVSVDTPEVLLDEILYKPRDDHPYLIEHRDKEKNEEPTLVAIGKREKREAHKKRSCEKDNGAHVVGDVLKGSCERSW